ncbi:SusC/RagA family TonB-linked outer membrane protein [Salegentibacter sp. BLCTC]|uniref:TonB-dependent receptor n=1 Tax=Salegentibacter maritimus TaxID=2794347 RepID=A0ABS0TKE0_9FLAO|nr:MULTISPECIES: TonB-dependent receptor [Salegentibacter]MBE7640570.1 SusC/RagA family TonB-linked outer membrane protein [Salegentibacter sp. BLCTC]MBI6121255.1 TonB-dependent receptor [Salegentibacter maritimus]
MKKLLIEKNKPQNRLWNIAPFLFFLSFLLSFTAYSQGKISISGTVTDETGIPLPGVTVMEKNTNNGVVTDFDGNYEIVLPDSNTVLSFRYVGFLSQDIEPAGRDVINIVLKEDIAALNEVVVVGYGKQERANLTGAVSTVNAETIEDRPVTNLGNALQGTTSGLNISRTTGQPGDEGLNIQIRGATSANGNVDPLLIVDGVTMSLNDLNTINPTDVKTVTVLKDAAAAAIYGSRAAGGVILVTTKEGKSGKTVVDYSSLLTVQWPLNIPDRLSLLEEAEFSNLARKNAGVGPEYSDFDLDNIRNGVEFVVSPTDSTRYLTYNQKSIKDQVARDLYLMQSHNVSARGGSDKVNYFFSVGYLDQEGMFKVGPDGNKRLNTRLNMSAELSKHLSLDSRLAYNVNDRESPSAGVNGYGLLQQVWQARQRFPIFTPEGKLFGGAGTSGNNTYAYLTEGGYANDKRAELNGTFTLTASNFIDGLELKMIYGRQENRRDYDRFNRTVELWDRFSPVYYLNNPNSYTVLGANYARDNFQFLTNYNITLFNNHKIHLLGGYQWEDYRGHSVTSSASSLVSNDLPSLNLGDANSKRNSEGVTTFANQSYFGRFNYSFKDKYLLEATIRGDETSRLAPGSRLKWFPSGSIGWNMHKEKWFETALPFFSEFKPRASWGQLGNANADIIGYYDYIPGLNYGNALVMGATEDRTTYFYQGGLPSPNLAWETVETVNYGVDVSLFKNKLQGSFDYYIKHNRNMLIPTNLPATIGINTPRVNRGELKSWGWETNLNFRDKIGDDFSYNIGFNLSDNQNELISYGGNRNTVGSRTNRLIEGFPLNTIWGYETVPGYIESESQLENAPFYDNRTGIGDIEYVDQNGDGLINNGGGTVENHGDLVKLGTDQSRYLFGINAGANYKNIDFSIFFQGVGKRSFLAPTAVVMPFNQTWFQPMAFHRDFWTPNNPDAAFPRPFLKGTHNYATSDRWVQDGSYVRLKNIQLGYSLSQKVISQLPISRFRIYVTGEDLLLFNKLGVFDGVFDPEQRNEQRANYPFTGKVALGINLSF